MIELLQETTKNPLELIGRSAGICYGSDINNSKKNINRGKRCIADGHGRVMEWPEVNMIIIGYSAKCLRELYTHIVGVSRLQASTRYIDYSKDKNFAIITPPKIENNENALKAWNEHMKNTQALIADMIEMGVPVEDATMALPLAYESKMIWKVNLRCLVNFMNMRLCTRAYWEIRNLANELKKALSEYSEEWKYICDLLFVPKCEFVGYCTEHECCGRKLTKERFEARETFFNTLRDMLDNPDLDPDCILEDEHLTELFKIAKGE